MNGSFDRHVSIVAFSDVMVTDQRQTVTALGKQMLTGT